MLVSYIYVIWWPVELFFFIWAISQVTFSKNVTHCDKRGPLGYSTLSSFWRCLSQLCTFVQNVIYVKSIKSNKSFNFKSSIKYVWIKRMGLICRCFLANQGSLSNCSPVSLPHTHIIYFLLTTIFSYSRSRIPQTPCLIPALCTVCTPCPYRLLSLILYHFPLNWLLPSSLLASYLHYTVYP